MVLNEQTMCFCYVHSDCKDVFGYLCVGYYTGLWQQNKQCREIIKYLTGKVYSVLISGIASLKVYSVLIKEVSLFHTHLCVAGKVCSVLIKEILVLIHIWVTLLFH